MAKPVDFRKFTPEDSREDLLRRIAEAPKEHAEAILASFRLLQRLHEKGVLDLLNGLLSAGDEVVNQVVNAVSSEQAIAILRTTLILSNILGSIDPDKVNRALLVAGKESPSLFALAKQASSKDARRGLSVAMGLIGVLGQALYESRGGNERSGS